MKTTTTYSPMTACRNPKVSARNVAEYLVVPNIMLPTNQPTNQPTNLYIYYILNLISSDGEICRQGASLAMRPAVSHPFPCLFSVLLILPSSPLSFRRPKGGRISGTQRKENTKKVNVDATEILHYTSFRSE